MSCTFLTLPHPACPPSESHHKTFPPLLTIPTSFGVQSQNSKDVPPGSARSGWIPTQTSSRPPTPSKNPDYVTPASDSLQLLVPSQSQASNPWTRAAVSSSNVSDSSHTQNVQSQTKRNQRNQKRPVKRRRRQTSSPVHPSKNQSDSQPEVSDSKSEPQNKSKGQSRCRNSSKSCAGRTNASKSCWVQGQKALRSQVNDQNKSTAASSANEDGQPKKFDFSQQSKSNSSKTRQTRQSEEDGDPVKDFFHKPFWKEGNAEGTALNYCCKWCSKVYWAHGSSLANLKTHCDGSTQISKNNKGCLKQVQAIAIGTNLPPTVAQNLAKDASNQLEKGKTSISKFVQKVPTFNNQILNQLLVIWQIRQALPWKQIKDPYLVAALKFCNSLENPFSQTWSANEAKRLHSSLKGQVYNNISNSK
ncbi:hypothetical protein PCANC_01749 [Puccinia coronata f. sp. avenae]|uniref:Uncharacterized protein n=1 Tax=Puccinia coronata f. sp. avenae TaxID=200324 RepID=A0A2N5W3J2_9BASI|nr:hypothetical protein PCANC_01749 [Puccinia coronata f. sp. avenae]